MENDGLIKGRDLFKQTQRFFLIDVKIVADEFPMYIRAAARSDCPANPTDLSSCSDSFVSWAVANNYAKPLWGHDLGFLNKLPTTSFTVSGVRIPGVVYGTECINQPIL